MASSSKPRVVFIPGSWHTTKHAQPLIDSLASRGYEASATQLASVGLKTLRPTFKDDVSTIHNAVSTHLDAGEDVCLILHSYAGVPGAQALNAIVTEGRLDRKPGYGKLIRVLFVTAYVFPTGFVMDAKMFIGPGDPNFSIDLDAGINHMANQRTAFFNDLPDDEAQKWVDTLEPAYYLGDGPVLTSDEWRFEHNWVDTGHTPYVSQPEVVADIIAKALSVEG